MHGGTTHGATDKPLVSRRTRPGAHARACDRVGDARWPGRGTPAPGRCRVGTVSEPDDRSVILHSPVRGRSRGVARVRLAPSAAAVRYPRQHGHACLPRHGRGAGALGGVAPGSGAHVLAGGSLQWRVVAAGAAECWLSLIHISEPTRPY